MPLPRTALATLGAAALTISLFPSLAVAAPADPTTTTQSFNISCNIVPSKISGPMVQTQAGSVAITAPAEVDAGDVFNIDYSIDGVTVPNTISAGPVTAKVQDVSRIKLDFEVPSNANYIGVEILDVGSFGTGTPPSVIRIDGNGTPSATGKYLRLSGANQTIGNGPSSSKSSSAGLRMRPSSGAETTVVFPKLRVILQANNPGVVEAKLRTDGAAANFGSDESFLTMLPQVSAPVVGAVWAPTACQPRDAATGGLNSGAGPLTSINVVQPGPADPGSIVTVLDGPGSVDVNERASFAATVGVAGDESAATEPLDGGVVQFYSDGVAIGSPRPVVRGIARLDLTYPAGGTKAVTAVYTDVDGNTAPISNTHLLTVIGPEPEPGDPGGPTPDEPEESTGSLGSMTSILGSLSDF